MLLRFIKDWWISALVLLAVLWLTLAPEPVGKTHIELFEGADKVMHACMMGALDAAILFDWWRSHRRKLNWTFVGWTALAMTVFSALDEWAQSAMDLGRTTDVWDFVADVAGIILSSLLIPPLLTRFKQK